MPRSPIAFAALTFCAIGAAHVAAHAAAHGSALQPALARQVDALLAPWTQPGKPGAAVAVIQDGKVVYRRGVGMADLQHNVPITPATPVHIASISKQFTAFAIHLLAQDGKLSLDDDVRKHIPELHDFGTPITLRHLIHHTSGLRDQWNLLAMSGWRLEDVITEDDILGLIKRQRALNAPPGQEHNYSNTGYTLLGIVVKRVSGKSLAQFTRERMFEPLGMRHTHFVEEYGALVKGRAASYGPSDNGGYDYVALSYSNAGATSLSTTVDDLARWDRNFYDGKVGGAKLLADMQTVGALNGAAPLEYASGLIRGSYRGLDTVEHSGGDAGYRSEFVRFPKQRFSVIVLANAGDFDAGATARKIADIYLARIAGTTLQPQPAQAAASKPARVEVAVAPERLEALVGTFMLGPAFHFTITREGGNLFVQPTGQPRYPLFATGERSFFLKVVDGDVTFDAPGSDGVISSGTYRQDGNASAIVRVKPRVMERAQLAAYAGEYYSDELHVLYSVKLKDDGLTVTYPRGEMALHPASRHGFQGGYPLNWLEFQCGAGDCRTFTVDNGRVRGLQFTKVSVLPVAAGGATQAFVTPKLVPNAMTFADEPMFLRGSMNDWSVRQPLRQAAPNRFETTLALAAGKHEFKIGSIDFRTVDLGAAATDTRVQMNAPKKMDRRGANLMFEVTQPASYTFVLDTGNPEQPVLSVLSVKAAP